MRRVNRFTWILGLLVISATSACREPAERAEESQDSCRIIIAGHIYSLGYRDHLEGDAGAVLDDRWLEAFAQQLTEDRPAAVFLLGDSSRDGQVEEWQRLKSIFANVASPIHYLAGNHDLRAPKVFDAQGGLRNAVFDYCGQRFITLDNKCVFEAEDLEFVTEALATNPGAAQPIILMHYMMVDWHEAQPGQDPREDYPGVSNWNRDVVPLIAGKVEAVICGDHLPGGPRLRQQEHDGQTIKYLMTSFVFSRSHDGGAGEGPNIYLELEIGDDQLQVHPRLLSLPLADPWYLDPRPPLAWQLQELSNDRGWLWLPPSFQSRGQDAWLDADRGIELEFLSQPRPVGMSREALMAKLEQEFMSHNPWLQTLAGGDFIAAGSPARWEWLAEGGGRRFLAIVLTPKEVWVLQGRQTVESAGTFDARLQLIEIAAGLKAS